MEPSSHNPTNSGERFEAWLRRPAADCPAVPSPLGTFNSIEARVNLFQTRNENSKNLSQPLFPAMNELADIVVVHDAKRNFAL